MKKLSKFLRLLMFAVALSLISSCEVGWTATVPGPGPVVVESTPPYAGAVWIGPEYYWSGGRYVVREGHWERGRGTWHPGSWTPKRNGYYWRRGHW